MPKIRRSYGPTTVGLAPGLVPPKGIPPRCPHSNMLFGKEIETGVSLNCYMCTPLRPKDEKPLRKTEAA
jgi:hypothetical protein